MSSTGSGVEPATKRGRKETNGRGAPAAPAEGTSDRAVRSVEVDELLAIPQIDRALLERSGRERAEAELKVLREAVEGAKRVVAELLGDRQQARHEAGDLAERLDRAERERDVATGRLREAETELARRREEVDGLRRTASALEVERDRLAAEGERARREAEVLQAALDRGAREGRARDEAYVHACAERETAVSERVVYRKEAEVLSGKIRSLREELLATEATAGAWKAKAEGIQFDLREARAARDLLQERTTKLAVQLQEIAGRLQESETAREDLAGRQASLAEAIARTVPAAEAIARSVLDDGFAGIRGSESDPAAACREAGKVLWSVRDRIEGAAREAERVRRELEAAEGRLATEREERSRLEEERSRQDEEAARAARKIEETMRDLDAARAETARHRERVSTLKDRLRGLVE